MRLLRLWRLARYLQHQADKGCELIPVPRWLAPEIHSHVWARKTNKAAEKWAKLEAEIPLDQWRSAMRARGEQSS